MYRFAAVLGLSLLLLACGATARKQLWIVGSSTLYPFVAAAAEQFGRGEAFPTPIVEANGTGGGIKLFCGGVGAEYPDIVNASREIKANERELCKQQGVETIAEFAVGFDGIVLANLKSAARYNLTREQLFKALAKVLPDESGALKPNPYHYWNEIDAALPHTKIEIYGPPPTSGTRDAFAELVMEHSCKENPAFVKAFPDENTRKEQCHLLREDGGFVDAGENDNIIVQKLQHNADALGIFGYSFLEQNSDNLQGSLIEGYEPSFDNITSGQYSVSRSLYMYIKQQHIGKTPGFLEFMKEMLSERAIGDEGYLAYKGLIPLPEVSRKLNRERLAAVGMIKN